MEFSPLNLAKLGKSLNLDFSGICPFLYLPVKRPNASGEYANNPIPSLIQSSAVPISKRRFSKLYGF